MVGARARDRRHSEVPSIAAMVPTQRRLSAVAAQLRTGVEAPEHCDPLGLRAAKASALSGGAAAPSGGERTLTAAELAQFRSQGYVVVPGVFEDEDFADLEEELGRLVDGFAQVCGCRALCLSLPQLTRAKRN